tara:strand:+ start:2207 stop:2788 length:582 start_codon:yes stop_codon:yes gene_type:complete
MKQLQYRDILSLDDYETRRDSIKYKIIEHKKHRSVMIGDHILLLFEDYYTISYQVQEMLRIEKIEKKSDILEELKAYTPLIPDGDNLKATMLIMYPDVSQRRIMLEKLNGIENEIWISTDGGKRLFANSDEDLERANDKKTSAVHFLRFQLNPECVYAIKNDGKLRIGSNHLSYDMSVIIDNRTLKSLREDLD